MENEVEDPDLVTGEVQPRKAFNQIEAIWNPGELCREILNLDAMRRLPRQRFTT